MGEPRARVDRGIYKIGKDHYEVVVSRGWDPVRRRYRQKTERVHGGLKDARDVRARLLLEVKEGQHAGADIPLADVVDAWLEQRRKLGRAPKTLREYRADADRYWLPSLGATPIREITRPQLQAIINALIDAGKSAATLDHVHACISGTFSHAMRQEWITRDVSKLLELPSIDKRRAVVPTPADVVTLLRAATSSDRPEMARVIWIGAVCGARNSEIRALRLSDFHAAEGRLAIERAISDGQVWSTKNRQIRDNHLDDVTAAVVADQVDHMRAMAADLGVDLPVDAYLFSEHPAGVTHWREETITKFFSRLADDAGLGQYTFKHLRKFMDTWGQALGFTREQVASRAGHDPQVAWEHYTGQVVDTDRALSTALAAVLVDSPPDSAVS